MANRIYHVSSFEEGEQVLQTLHYPVVVRPKDRTTPRDPDHPELCHSFEEARMTVDFYYDDHEIRHHLTPKGKKPAPPVLEIIGLPLIVAQQTKTST